MLDEHAAGCRDMRFATPLTLQPAAEVALEDYARVLTRARHAEVMRATPAPTGSDAGPVAGVHLCDPAAECQGPQAADVEAFAREMAAAAANADGLGWS